MCETYILIDGKPVLENNTFKWGRFMEGNRILKHTRFFKKRVLVSTVFLGIDHNYSEKGEPVLWETMIFNGPHNEYQERYTSEEEALKGHEEACQLAADYKSYNSWLKENTEVGED